MFKIILTIVLCLISGVTFAAPANSNGNKLVFDWEDNWPVYCDGEPEMHWSISGRSAFNVIGHVVVNTVTGELVLAAGQHPFGGDDDNFWDFWPDDLACDFLY
jgi:hypothetical protein